MIFCIILNLLNVIALVIYTYAVFSSSELLSKMLSIGDYDVNIQIFVVCFLVILYIITKLICKIDLNNIKKKYKIPTKYNSEDEFIEKTKNIYRHEFYYSLIRIFYWIVIIILGWIVIVRTPLNGENFKYRILFNIVNIVYILFKILLPIIEIVIVVYFVIRLLNLKKGEYNLESNYCRNCNHGAINIIHHSPNKLINSELIKTEKRYGVNDGFIDYVKNRDYGYKLYRDNFEKRHVCINCRNVIIEKNSSERKEYFKK